MSRDTLFLIEKTPENPQNQIKKAAAGKDSDEMMRFVLFIIYWNSIIYPLRFSDLQNKFVKLTENQK